MKQQKHELLHKLVGLAIASAFALILTACGGGGGSAGTTSGGTGGQSGSSVSSITLTSSSNSLESSGISGTEVTITALLKDSHNVVVANEPVTWVASNGGSITPLSDKSDASGFVRAKLSTYGNPANRDITVTASTAKASATTIISVTGTSVTITSSNSVNRGETVEIMVVLKNSTGALANYPVTFRSVAGNELVGSSNTDSTGKLVLSYRPTSGSQDTIVVAALGVVASKSILINSTNFNIQTVDNSGNQITEANVGNCVKVKIHNDNGGVGQDGQINVSASRGVFYSNNTCTVTANSLTMADGEAVGYVKASSPGFSTLNATFVTTNAMVQTAIEFTAILVSPADATPTNPASTINLQASPAVIGVNSNGSTSQQSTITATVRTNNYPVKNAWVSFSLSGNGGDLLNYTGPVQTGSDGTAQIIFSAGPDQSGTNGITVTGSILSGAVTNFTKLTVAQQKLLIGLGTGNQISEPTTDLYQKTFVVNVTDAAGNPAKNAAITAAVKPVKYEKGYLVWSDDESYWVLANAYVINTGTELIPDPNYICDNEDTNENGSLDDGEDYNKNGRLDPGNGTVTVTTSGVTDANGEATVTLRYAQDHAYWTKVALTIRGQVVGSEGAITNTFWLDVLASDFNQKSPGPPGATSPYGIGLCTAKN